MRTVSLIIVHCSANKAGSALRAEDINRYHRSLGWKCCGYHYVIPTDGTIEAGRPEELVGAHCKHHIFLVLILPSCYLVYKSTI